jgi:hypothetical protein
VRVVCGGISGASVIYVRKEEQNDCVSSIAAISRNMCGCLFLSLKCVLGYRQGYGIFGFPQIPARTIVHNPVCDSKYRS